MISKMFYEKLKINLLDIKLEIEGEIDPDALSGKNKDAKIGFSKITTKYYINATNTKEEIEKFVEFVESHCPMKDTIIKSPDMKYEIFGKR